MDCFFFLINLIDTTREEIWIMIIFIENIRTRHVSYKTTDVCVYILINENSDVMWFQKLMWEIRTKWTTDHVFIFNNYLDLDWAIVIIIF